MDEVLQDYSDKYFPKILHPRTGKTNKTYLERLNKDLYAENNRTPKQKISVHNIRIQSRTSYTKLLIL